LKTLEKINRKAIRKSLEKGKPISAQVGPISLARARMLAPARPLFLTGGPRLSAPAPARPLSLAAPWAIPVGTGSLACAHSPSLCPTVPTCQSSSTFRPQSPLRGRAHDCVFSSHVRAAAPCSPTSPLLFAPSAQLALSLTLPTRAGSPATARQRPLSVPWLPSRRAPSSATVSFALLSAARDTPSVCPLPP
jgi:hypothetical protein